MILIDFYIFWVVTVFVCLVTNSSYRTFGFIFLLAWVSFYFGFRPLSLGVDTATYNEIYRTWSFGVFDSGLEYSFSFIFFLFDYVGLGYTFVQFFLSFIFFLLLLSAISRIYGRDAWILFVFIFSFTEVWTYSINIVRYGLAFSVFLFFLAFSFASKRLQIVYMIACAAVSLGFHFSILPLWLLYLTFSNRFFILFRYCYFVLILFSFGFFLLGFDLILFLYGFLLPFFDYFPGRVSSRIYNYLNHYDLSALSLGFSYLVVFLSVFFASFCYKNICYRNLNESLRLNVFKFSFVSSVVFLAFYPLLFVYDVFARLLSGFAFFSIFLLFEIVMAVFRRNSAIASILVISFLLFTKLVFLGFSSGFLSPRFL